MGITVYTVLTAFLATNLFFLIYIIIGFFQRVNYIYRPVFLFSIMVVCLLRLCVPVEFPFTIVLNSKTIVPYIEGILNTPVANIPVKYWLVIFSLTGSLFLLVNYILSVIKFRNFCIFVSVNYKPVDIKNNADLLDVDSNVKIYKVDLASSPFIGYSYSNMIFIPKKNYSKTELKCIIMHELMHYKNRHNIIKFVLTTLKILFWWNPLIYFFNFEVENMLEFFVDSKLKKKLSESEKNAYITAIIKSTKNDSGKNPNLTFNLIGQYNKKIIIQRINSFLNNKTGNKYKTFGSYLLLFAASLISYLFVIQPYYEPDMEKYNDDAPVIDADCYVVKTEDGYCIYNGNNDLIYEGSGQIDDNLSYLHIYER
ncbi:MAG TPA: hypothetical protein DCG28_05790 [Lachnospiraceae bacterium]|nr:hypothetical protein [Lachnospiraceae bacterium]